MEERQIVKVENFGITIVSVTTSQYVKLKYVAFYHTAKPGMKLIIVRVSIWNMGNVTKSLHNSQC